MRGPTEYTTDSSWFGAARRIRSTSAEPLPSPYHHGPSRRLVPSRKQYRLLASYGHAKRRVAAGKLRKATTMYENDITYQQGRCRMQFNLASQTHRTSTRYSVVCMGYGFATSPTRIKHKLTICNVFACPFPWAALPVIWITVENETDPQYQCPGTVTTWMARSLL